MYAEIMRAGESRRDASSKIRGFIYQDLIVVDYLFSDKNDSSHYIEWVEDIFIENETSLCLIQVKYYPQSSVKFEDIYTDMFYQFIKYKLVGSAKQVEFKCLHFSNSEFDEEECNNVLSQKFTYEKINESNIDEIWSKHNEIQNFEGRKNYLLSSLGCIELLSEFSLTVTKSLDFVNLRQQIASKIYNSIHDLGCLALQDESKIKSILLANVVEFIQNKYSTNSNSINYRAIQKNELITYINDLISGIENKPELVIGVFFEAVDEILNEFMEAKSEYDDAILSWYRDLYLETKHFYSDLLKYKDYRFLFINTVCTNKDHDGLNSDLYSNLTVLDEWKLYLENKEKIKIHIIYMWKLLFNDKFGENVMLKDHIVLSNKTLMFKMESESRSPIFLSTEVYSSRKTQDVIQTISRVEHNEPKPIKWYMGIGGNNMKVLDYSYEVTNLKSALKDGYYEVNDIDDNQFILECMGCLKCSIIDSDMQIKEEMWNNICSRTCIWGE